MSVYVTIIICIAIIIFVGMICFTCYKNDIHESKNKILLFDEKMLLKDNTIQNQEKIIQMKEDECLRLTKILTEVLEKSKSYSIDANVKI